MWKQMVEWHWEAQQTLEHWEFFPISGSQCGEEQEAHTPNQINDWTVTQGFGDTKAERFHCVCGSGETKQFLSHEPVLPLEAELLNYKQSFRFSN